jgi:hypothetical protein
MIEESVRIPSDRLLYRAFEFAQPVFVVADQTGKLLDSPD